MYIKEEEKSLLTDWIFDEDLVRLFAGFSSSSQILSQDSELVLLPGGQAFNSAIKETKTCNFSFTKWISTGVYIYIYIYKPLVLNWWVTELPSVGREAFQGRICNIYLL